MTSAWDELTAGGKSDFLNIEVGKKYVIHIYDKKDVVKKVKHWVDKKPIVCSQNETCELCKKKDKPTHSGLCNVYSYSDKANKIVEMTAYHWSKIKKSMEDIEEADISKLDFIVSKETNNGKTEPYATPKPTNFTPALDDGKRFDLNELVAQQEQIPF